MPKRKSASWATTRLRAVAAASELVRTFRPHLSKQISNSVVGMRQAKDLAAGLHGTGYCERRKACIPFVRVRRPTDRLGSAVLSV